MNHAYKTPLRLLKASCFSLALLTCGLAQAQYFPGQDDSDAEGQQAPDEFPTQIPQTDGDSSPPTDAPPTFFPSSPTLFPETQSDFDQQAELQQQLNALQQGRLNEFNAFQLDARRQQMLDLNAYWGEVQGGTMRPRQMPLVTPQMDFEFYSSRYPGGYFGYPVWHPSHPNFNNLNQPNFDNQQPAFTDQQPDLFKRNPNSADADR